MTLLASYQDDVRSGLIQSDPIQLQALTELQRCFNDLQALQARSRWQRWWQGRVLVQGVYLWGGVGIGKTYLMDKFFQALPGDRKRRLHFHQFMHDVHQSLKARQGTASPLVAIAKALAAEVDVICFDEFVVNDITDAMLLGNLLEALFAEGVCLVATSNVAPDDLYRNGLQRSRFLPAIALLQAHTHICHLPSEQDYRCLTLQQAGVFFTPLTAENEAQIRALFAKLSHNEAANHAPLRINDRDIAVVASVADVAWFRFDALCSLGRSQLDYLEIAMLYSTVIITEVPALSAAQSDLALYFIYLIDVLYDAKVKLILSAAVPIADIYTQGRQSFVFARTVSRLQEMQSESYLHQAHQHVTGN